MNLKSTVIVSAALLLVSAPAWADSVKTQASDSSGTAVFSHSDIKRLGGFKSQDSRLLDVEPDGDADDTVTASEPGSIGLLLTGLLCIGAIAGAVAYRRNQSVANA